MSDVRTKFKLVFVEWIDSRGCSPIWQPISNAAGTKPSVCWSVGWVVSHENGCRVIVPHVTDGDPQGCGDMTIPDQAVVRIRDLALMPEVGV